MPKRSERARIGDMLDIHGYFEVDLEIVWSTVTKEIPPLIPALEKLLNDLPPASPG